MFISAGARLLLLFHKLFNTTVENFLANGPRTVALTGFGLDVRFDGR